MTMTDILKDRVHIQVKTTVQTALGETKVWSPVETKRARVVPLDAKARAVYQQLKRDVSYKVVFRGSVSLSLGNNRFLWNDKTLKLVEPPQEIGNSTVVMVKEV